MRSDRSATPVTEPPAGCATCAGHGHPGYIPGQLAIGGASASAWRRCPARCGAANRQDQQVRSAVRLTGRALLRQAAAARRAAAVPVAAPAAPAPAPRRAPKSAAPQRNRRPAAPAREVHPVVLVDADGGELVADTADLPGLADVRTLAGLLGWLAAASPMLGVPRPHKDARALDPVVVLSAAAAALLKLPADYPAAKALERLESKVVKAAGDAGVEVGAVGPSTKVFRRRTDAAAKVSLTLLVVPWLGQGDARQAASVSLVTKLAGTADGPDGRALARRLRALVAALGITPGASEATTAMMMLEAVRPREQWDTATRRFVLKDGALPSGDLCAPVAAGSRHPITRDLIRAGERVCEEEDYKAWARPLTADERLLPWAVTVDVSTSYLSVTERLGLPVGPLELETPAAWSPKRAGLWWCDFTGVAVDELLPHPSEWNGRPPTGPGWYATPTVEYMVKTYGFNPAAITRAWVSTHTAALLEEWTARLRDAYKGAMAALGVVDGMEPSAFLAAYANRRQGDADALVLADVYKGIYKGGTGRWTYRGDTIKDDGEWAEKVAARWWYRPEIRAHVIAAARIAAHRRMRRTLELTGLAPFAANVDALMYASSEPSPFPLLPTKPDGSPVPGALRLGAAPGSFKHESSVPMAAILAAVDQDVHPAKLIHDFTPAGAPADSDDAPEGE